MIRNAFKNLMPFIVLLSLILACSTSTEDSDEKDLPKEALYEATNESISQHPLPEWYDDAKLGIFICWGLYSVPGWAQGTEIPLEEVFAKNLGEVWFKENPYAEWYLNSLKIEESATKAHHDATYGPDFQYGDFLPVFNESSKAWNPDEMADFIQSIGAGYVVLVSKFHDGVMLWPTAYPNPNQPEYITERDIVGELTAAVKARDMKMGLYYSSGLDWTFNDLTIKRFEDLVPAVPQEEAYVNYVDNHWRELMQKYEPSILWADIGSPDNFDAVKLIADFYNQNPEGVVNNRHKMSFAAPTGAPGTMVHHDFTTPEYQVLDDIAEEKWETVRGIGLSFGYNQNEGEEEYLNVDELVDMFIDIVSKNGNLLLNIGPDQYGAIPPRQKEVLEGFGAWLKINGEALFGTRPWKQASVTGKNEERIRFTSKGDKVFMMILDPVEKGLEIPNFPVEEITSIKSLASGAPVDFEIVNGSLRLSGSFSSTVAYAFEIILP
jgi:alpha-L-fucosidase